MNLFGLEFFQEIKKNRRARLTVLWLVLVVVALMAVVMSFSIIQQNGENQKLKETVAKLSTQLGDVEKEHQSIQKELETANKTIEEQKEVIVKAQKEAEAKAAETEQRVYLTFDDGPHENTNKVLDVLKSYDIKATFFVNGRESEESIEIYKRIVDEGHTIANHTYSHAYEDIYASTDAFMADVNKLEEMLREKAGITMPKIVRFPGGSNNTIATAAVLQNIKDTLTEQGYRYFDWNVSGEDAVKKGTTASEIYNEVIRTTEGKEKPVVLLHSGSISAGTVDALPKIIDYYIKNGFAFHTLDDEYVPEVVLKARTE